MAEPETLLHAAGITVGQPTPEQAKAQDEWVLANGTPAQKQAILKRRRRATRNLGRAT